MFLNLPCVYAVSCANQRSSSSHPNQPESTLSVVTCGDHSTCQQNKIRLFISLSKHMKTECIFLGATPLPVTNTTRIIKFVVGNPYKPRFAAVTGWGVDPGRSIILHSLSLQANKSFNINIKANAVGFPTSFPFKRALSKRKRSDSNGSQTSRYCDFASFWGFRKAFSLPMLTCTASRISSPWFTKILVHQVQGKLKPNISIPKIPSLKGLGNGTS